jgi:hypothetical protein
LTEHVENTVKEHFKRKELEKKDKPINPSNFNFFIGMCEENKKSSFQSSVPKEAVNRTACCGKPGTTRAIGVFEIIEAHYC